METIDEFKEDDSGACLFKIRRSSESPEVQQYFQNMIQIPQSRANSMPQVCHFLLSIPRQGFHVHVNRFI